MSSKPGTIGALSEAVEQVRATTEETSKAVVKIAAGLENLARLMQEPGQDSLPTKVRILDELLRAVERRLDKAEERRWLVYLALLSALAGPLIAWIIAKG